MTEKENNKEAVVKKIKDWAASPEGKAKIKEAFESAKRMKEQFRKERKIDPRKLNEPMTL